MGALASVHVFSKRRWIVLATVILFVLVAWGFEKNREPVYEAVATVLPSEAALQQPVLIGGTGGAKSGASRETQLANLMRIAESRTVWNQTIESLPEIKSTDSHESLKASLVGGKGANRSLSEMLEIRTRSNSPARAISLANTAAQVFVSYHQDLRLRDIQSRRSFLEEQMVVAAKALKQADTNLAEFEKKHGVALLNPNPRRRRSSSTPDVEAMESELSIVRRQIREVTALLAQTPRTIPEKGAPADPVLLKDLQDELAAVREQLKTELAASPESEQVSRLRQQADELQRRLLTIGTRLRNVPNPEYERLILELAGLKEERNQLLQELSEAEQLILRRGYVQPGADVKLAALLRAREGAIDHYSDIQARLSQVRMEEEQAGASQSLRIIDEAVRAEGPLGPSRMLVLLGSLLAGLLVGFGAAHLQEAVEQRNRIRDNADALMDLPVAALVPHCPNCPQKLLPRICYDDPVSPVAEAFRFLRTDILLSAAENGMKTVMVATAKPGQGGSIVAANLAICLAQDGKRVVLVDADLRRPTLHRVFKLDNEIGLAEVLKDEHDLPEAIANTEVDNLALIPAGSTPLNPTELLGSWRMRSIIGSLKEVADFVVIDTPAAVAFADTIVLSQLVDGVLMVTRSRDTAGMAVIQVKNLLNKAKARILGVVLNDITPDNLDSYHSYSHYYPGDSKKRLPATEHTTPAIPPHNQVP